MKKSKKVLVLLAALATFLFIPDTQAYNATETGGAYATMAGKFGGELTKKEIQQCKEVGVAGCAEGSKIYKFDLYIYSGGKTTRFSGSSNVLTTDISGKLNALKKGDSFEFKRIKAHLPNGNSVDVVGRKFVIV